MNELLSTKTQFSSADINSKSTHIRALIQHCAVVTIGNATKVLEIEASSHSNRRVIELRNYQQTGIKDMISVMVHTDEKFRYAAPCFLKKLSG